MWLVKFISPSHLEHGGLGASTGNAGDAGTMVRELHRSGPSRIYNMHVIVSVLDRDFDRFSRTLPRMPKDEDI